MVWSNERSMKGLSRENISPQTGRFCFLRQPTPIQLQPCAHGQPLGRLLCASLRPCSAETLLELALAGHHRGCQPIVLSETLCGLLLSPVVRGGIRLGVVLEQSTPALEHNSCSGTQLIVILPLEPALSQRAWTTNPARFTVADTVRASGLTPPLS